MKGLKTVVTCARVATINATHAPQKEVAGIIVEIDGTMTRVMTPALSVSTKPAGSLAANDFITGRCVNRLNFSDDKRRALKSDGMSVGAGQI